LTIALPLFLLLLISVPLNRKWGTRLEGVPPSRSPLTGGAGAPHGTPRSAKARAASIHAETFAIAEILKSIYGQPENGLIRSSFPSSMNVNVVSAVVVEIRGPDLASTKNLPALQSEKDMTELRNQLRVGNTMSVSLTAQDQHAFDIASQDSYGTPSEPVAKPVAPNGLQQWRWSVTPLRSGTQTLYVTAYITVPVPGENVPPLQVYLKTQIITVPVVPLYERSWWAVRDAFSNYWGDLLKWSWTALVVPLVVWLRRRYAHKEKNVHAENSYKRILRLSREDSKNKSQTPAPPHKSKAG